MREPLKLTRAHDPLLILFTFLALLGVSLTLGSRAKAPAPPPGTTRTLKALELQLELGQRVEALQPGISKKFLEAGRELKAPWDRAAWAVEAQEAGDAPLADSLRTSVPRGPEGEAYARAWNAAYEEGLLPAEVPPPLASTRAGRLLENRLRARQELAPLPLPHANLGLLVSLGLIVALLLLGGVATVFLLLATAKHPKPPQPQWRMDGRGALLVMVGWLVGFFLLNTVVALLFRSFPQGRLWSLPVGYALHASFGVWLLMKVEGLSFREVRARVFPEGRTTRALAWWPAFLSLALLTMFVVAVLWGPFLKGHSNPQQEVQDLLAGAKGWPVQAVLFFTLAVLAPCFEELMFRGFLLPWSSDRWGAGWGLALSSLLFGFIHLQPWALPMLASLGLVLGLAVRKSGSIWTSILVHGCWNGGIFMLLRLF